MISAFRACTRHGIAAASAKQSEVRRNLLLVRDRLVLSHRSRSGFRVLLRPGTTVCTISAAEHIKILAFCIDIVNATLSPFPQGGHETCSCLTTTCMRSARREKRQARRFSIPSRSSHATSPRGTPPSDPCHATQTRVRIGIDDPTLRAVRYNLSLDSLPIVHEAVAPPLPHTHSHNERRHSSTAQTRYRAASPTGHSTAPPLLCAGASACALLMFRRRCRRARQSSDSPPHVKGYGRRRCRCCRGRRR